jgi:hypothetical protein
VLAFTAASRLPARRAEVRDGAEEPVSIVFCYGRRGGGHRAGQRTAGAPPAPPCSLRTAATLSIAKRPGRTRLPGARSLRKVRAPGTVNPGERRRSHHPALRRNRARKIQRTPAAHVHRPSWGHPVAWLTLRWRESGSWGCHSLTLALTPGFLPVRLHLNRIHCSRLTSGRHSRNGAIVG